jgi:type II secretory pathway pseudopilin PulG
VTARDRTVLIVVGLLATVAAFWMLALSPKRKDASDLGAQLTSAQQRLDTANAGAATAEAAKKRYNSDYATVARLGKAVPVEDDVPSLVYQLEHTAHDHHIDFRSIELVSSSSISTAAPTGAAAAVASANGTTPAPAGAAAVTTALPPGATVGTAGFPTMPFSFDFNGSFFNMQKFLNSLDALTTVQGKSIDVRGRLLTVDGIDLKAGPKGFPDVTAKVAVTAYLLPADEGLTAGAAPGTPAGTGSAQPASTSKSSTTAGTPATASLIEGDR